MTDSKRETPPTSLEEYLKDQAMEGAKQIEEKLEKQEMVEATRKRTKPPPPSNKKMAWFFFNWIAVMLLGLGWWTDRMEESTLYLLLVGIVCYICGHDNNGKGGRGSGSSDAGDWADRIS